MGGAVMLLAIATFGITYGWTPDGGSGVQYIIQIPPEKLDQVARTGEISSRIPDEIRGHVSEIVIRVGNGALPRVTPNHVTQANTRVRNQTAQRAQQSDSMMAMDSRVSIEDSIPVPIPSMSASASHVPIPGQSSTSLMKPAPQGGGMNLPGGYNPVAASGSPQQQGQQPDNPRLRLAQPSAYGNQANANAMNANSMTGGADAFTMPPPFTGTVRENGQVAPPNYASTRSGRGLPSTAQAHSTAGSLGASQVNSSQANSSQSNSAGANSAGANSAGGRDQWYDLRNAPRRPSTNPVEASTASTSRRSTNPTGNFAKLPSGLDMPGSNERSSRQAQTNTNQNVGPSLFAKGGNDSYATSTPNDLRNAMGARQSDSRDYDPRLTPEQARQLPPNAYSLNAGGYPIDRQGNLINQYGTAVDEQGRPLNTSANQQTASSAIGSNRGQASQAPYGGNSLAGNNSILLANQLNGPKQAIGANSGNGYGQQGGSGQAGQPNQIYPGQQGSNGQGYGQQNPNGMGNQLGSPNLLGLNGQPGNIPQYPNVPNYANQQYPNPNQNYTGNVSPYGSGAGPYMTQPAGSPYGQPAMGGQGYLGPIQPPLAPQGPQTPSGQYAGGNYPASNPYQYTDPSQARLASNSGRDTTNREPMDSTLVSAEDRGKSASDRLGSTRLGDNTISGAGSLREPESVAAQPLFNGLLLVSFVANIYLFFWLKSMRSRFRDMVAAKRAVASSSALAPGVS